MNGCCVNCGHEKESCVCDAIHRDGQLRDDLERYQDEYGLTNDEMTDFIEQNDIY